MKIYDVLNPYKLLCKEVEQLDESLSTDFSIGFELEGVCTREGFSSYNLPGYHSHNEPTGVVKELFDDINRELGFGEGKIEKDGSLGTDVRGAWTFEYGSPIIPFNPANINKIYNFLKKLPSLQVHTNDSCGFHTHISFKGINKINTAWIMCCLAIDEKIQEELRGLKSVNGLISFASQWSKSDLFDYIKDNLKEENYERISDLLDSSDKYNLVRVHPAGTMEWRGPRNFLNNADIDDIHEYIKKVYRVIMAISKINNSKEYTGSGITINRKEIEKKVTVTDDFNSPEQKRIDAKSAGFYTRFKENPIILNSLKNNNLINFINQNLNKIMDSIEGWYSSTSFSNKLSQVKPQTLNILLEKLWEKSDNGKQVCFIFLKKVDDEYMSFINKVDKKLLAEFVNMAIKNKVKFDNDYYFRILKRYDLISKYSDIVTKILLKLPFNDNAIEVFKYLNTEIPLNYYTKILNSKDFYKLAQFENLPVKIQRMMVRKSPYMVQYIQHLDPQILAALKQKYPNIEQYVLGEL